MTIEIATKTNNRERDNVSEKVHPLLCIRVNMINNKLKSKPGITAVELTAVKNTFIGAFSWQTKFSPTQDEHYDGHKRPYTKS